MNTYVSPAPEILDNRFYSFSVFKISSVTDRSPVNINIPAPRTGALQTGSKKQNLRFLENRFDDSDC
jgi:hypothetical protein